RRRLQLRLPDVVRRAQNLALQVAEVDDVEVDDADRADAGGGEIHRDRRAESACADAQDLRRLQLFLPVEADLRKDQVPAVPLDLVFRQFGEGGRRFGRREAARDRRDDADGVAGLDGRLLFLQIADVLI